MKELIAIVFLLLYLAIPASAVRASQAAPSSAVGGAKANSHMGIARNQNTPPTGEAVFKANCARCHTPPTSISPRITGTVIMHMRTRARLSRQDEQLLLQYMAP